ncbi:unnamed protein product [Lota lota]
MASWALWLLLLAFAWNGQGCGMAPLNTKLVGGQAATTGKWPWQASLHIATATVASFYTCGGTLLSQQWVLTAANCMQTSAVGDYTVFLGRQTQQGPNPNEVQRSVSEIHIHPSYNASSFQNDLALLRLDSTVQYTDYIQPICLAASDSTFFNASCSVTGWGKQTQNATSTSNVLQEMVVPLVTQEECQGYFKGVNITSAMLCAGEPGKGICQNSVWLQVGIVSFGELCANGIPDVYTKVSAFQSWIQQRVGVGGGAAEVATIGFMTFPCSSTSGVHHFTLFYLPLLPLLALLG